MTAFDVIIIGGGASGCFAAVHVGEKGEKVLLTEPGRLMHKLSLTGKGRCNLTNNSDIDNILKNIKTNPRFMRSALSKYGSADVMSFFEKSGVPLKTERGNRVFPVSDKADDIVCALKRRLNIPNVKIVNRRAVEILVKDGAVTGVRCEENVYSATKVILATGGLSYPKTGSTGDGYKIASALGHTIIPPRPSLVPIVTRENCSELAGLSLKNVKISLFPADMNKLLYSEQGELLFTHFGISGPLALSASFYIDNPGSGYKILTDLKPALDVKKLDARILRDFDKYKNKQIQNALNDLLPQKLIPFVISQSNIHPDKRVNEITSAERRRVLDVLKGFELTFAGLRPIDEAVITDGGVDTREINPKNMESKLIRGLRFAGEIIDVAAFTGGYNLQIAFSTAYAAAGE